MNMLMNGLSPVGMVYNQSAENIAYDSNNSVKDMLDIVTENKTNWYVRSYGKIVSVYISGNITMDSTGYTSTEAMSEQFRPTTTVKPTIFTKVYNGSNYVDCQVMIGEDGKLRFRDNFGNAISGIQTQYLKSLIITYIL